MGIECDSTGFIYYETIIYESEDSVCASHQYARGYSESFDGHGIRLGTGSIFKVIREQSLLAPVEPENQVLPALVVLGVVEHFYLRL